MVEFTLIATRSPATRRELAHPTGLFTVAEVSQACGLPVPVVMQLVPRTWVERVGWLYTRDQIGAAIAISEELGRPSPRSASSPREPIEMLCCTRCAALTPAGDARARNWFNLVDPNSVGPAAWDGKDYCAQCVTRCPNCPPAGSDRLCRSCFGTRRVARPPLSRRGGHCAAVPQPGVE